MKDKKQGGLGKIFSRGKAFYRTLSEHKFTTIAGTLTFFFVLSVVPFFFWLTLLFGKFLRTEDIVELGPIGWASDLLLAFREQAENAAAGVSIFFLATTLFSSSSFFYHLRRSGEIIYDTERVKHGWKIRLSALGLTLLVLIFFAAAVAVLLAGVYAVRFLSPWIAYPAEYILLFIIGYFSAWILNAYVSPYRLPASDTVGGSALTSALWIAASAAFSVYLRFFGGGKLYGALSAAVAALLFLYWMMICFTVGAVVCRLKARGRSLPSKTL